MLDRFIDHTEHVNGCWFWRGSLRKDGYGRFRMNGKTVLAHRASYFLHYGKVKPGSDVCHTCDNKACVNPEHLYLGDVSSNMRDKVRRSRCQYASRTHCFKGHEYTDENTYRHGGSRRCRRCQMIATKKYREKKHGR